MEAKTCFELGCKQEAEYACKCTFPSTYSCVLHAGKHLKLSNTAHTFESIFVDSCKETKEEILKILIEKISKYNKQKEMLFLSFNQHLLNSESNFEELIKVLDKSSDELKNYAFRISETKAILRFEQDPILGLLCLQPKEAIEKVKALIPANSNWFENADELKILSTLSNPYIICFDSYFKVESKTLIALKTFNLLKAIVDKQSKSQYFDEDEIWKYFIQTSFGLEALHSKGYIHGNIKPENILLDENKDVKLANFGFSRYLELSPLEATPSYFSPRMGEENFKAKESDIWALGCVLCYLCNLEDPFKLNKKKTQRKSYLPIKRQYSQELRDFISWCLKEKKNERPTINDIITHKFIVNKTISLDITIPATSSISTIYQELLNTKSRLESKLLESSNDIERLKAEIARLKKIINERGDYIETFRLEIIEIANLLENCKKTLKEKQFIKLKNSVKELIAYTEKIKKLLDHSEQDLNLKEPKIAQSKNINIITVQNLREKRSEILKSYNSPDLEKKFRMICSAYEKNSNAHDISVIQAYQDYSNTYHQKTSLFNLIDKDGITNLLVCNTETETQELKILQTSQPLDLSTCITQLPTGKLFCFGMSRCGLMKQMVLLIDENYNVEELPIWYACFDSSAIYFNNYIYCFGGRLHSIITYSSRFDLEKFQWNDLTPLPDADSDCNSVIFNGSILISGSANQKLLRYSIDSNSFTAIPYEFAKHKRKILINIERLYLIECGENASMHESEIGSDTAWRWIANDSTINFYPNQIYWAYNKSGMYIGCVRNKKYTCFKFNLNEKSLTKLFENEI